MSRPVGLFFADAHLDTHAWANYPQLRGDSQYAFAFLCRMAKKYAVVSIFAAGDLIDVRRPSSEVADFIRRQMTELQHEGGISFCYIQGQHELSDPPWMSAISGWPTHISEQFMHVGGGSGLKIYGLDWQPADRLAGKLADVPEDADILLAHQVWEDFMGDKANYEGSFEQIPTKTLFTGDFHKFVDREGVTGSKMQKVRVISPGATNLRAMGESPRKYFMLLNDDGTWVKKKIPSRPYIDVYINNEFDLKEFTDTCGELHGAVLLRAKRLPKHLQKPIYRFIHPENLSVEKVVRKHVGKYAFVFYKRSRVESEERQQRRRERGLILDRGVNGCLPLVMPRVDPRFKPLARLLESRDCKLELLQMKKETLDDEQTDNTSNTGT